jgi:hypothetical protein
LQPGRQKIIGPIIYHKTEKPNEFDETVLIIKSNYTGFEEVALETPILTEKLNFVAITTIKKKFSTTRSTLTFNQIDITVKIDEFVEHFLYEHGTN